MIAKLTPEDIDNYGKLKEAFDQITTIASDTAIAAIAVITKLRKPTVKNIEELSEIVNPLYSYWKILSALGKPLKFNESEKEPRKLEQQFSDSIENLKRSLNVIENEKVDLTDEIEEFTPDILFLKFVEEAESCHPIPPNFCAKKITKDLINKINLHLNESQIDYLTNIWGIAISGFVEDARNPGDKVDPGTLTTFAHFFRIHKELEVLYGRLANTEAVQLSE